MANQEQVERLKAGVEGWNNWRYVNNKIRIDLKGADLIRADLRGSNLAGANLSSAGLNDSNLTGADLGRADLSGAFLSGAILVEAHLSEAFLSGAYLSGSDLSRADLKNTEFKNASMGETILGHVFLSETKGLEDVEHWIGSTLGTNTLKLSKGKIPEKFLRGCGLSDWEIESAKLYEPGLSASQVNDIIYRIYDLRATQSIQINPLFISYSHKDEEFVDAIEKRLDKKGIRFWRDIHDATSGRLEKVIDHAIRQNPIMLLILSKDSVQSDWVEHEARKARELEKELGRDVICPVALDDAWEYFNWPERLKEQIMEYHIMDFSKWKDEEEFGKIFEKLIQGLDIFYREK
jgi:uncharacterized protein YjbI with pentapeptide repeats